MIEIESENLNLIDTEIIKKEKKSISIRRDMLSNSEMIKSGLDISDFIPVDEFDINEFNLYMMKKHGIVDKHKLDV